MSARISYIAAPYSDPDPLVTAGRMTAFEHAVGEMIHSGTIFPVSPLLNHYLLEKVGVPGDWAFWQHYSRRLLAKCDELVILALPGWGKSTGIKEEMAFAAMLSLPMRYVGYSHRLYDMTVSEAQKLA